MGWIGIDEARPECPPVIWVAVYSHNPFDAIEGRKKESKNWRTCSLETTIADKEFTHTIVTANTHKEFSHRDITFHAIMNLVNYFPFPIHGIRVDGEDGHKLASELRQALLPLKPKILFKKQGDERFPVVNAAHRVAAWLREYYGDFSDFAEKNFYHKNLAKPLNGDYDELLKKAA